MPPFAERQPTVLIVEDDEVLRLSTAALLVREGYLVLTAATSHDAMESLRTPLQPVDVVLLDVHLPDVDGVTLWSRVRQLFPELAVIVCTGEVDTEEVTRLMALGVRRLFVKPFSPDELLATVEAALS